MLRPEPVADDGVVSRDAGGRPCLRRGISATVGSCDGVDSGGNKATTLRDSVAAAASPLGGTMPAVGVRIIIANDSGTMGEAELRHQTRVEYCNMIIYILQSPSMLLNAPPSPISSAAVPQPTVKGRSISCMVKQV